VIINFYYSPEYLWFYYPLIFWGLGLILHLLSLKYLIKRYSLLLDTAKKKIGYDEHGRH